MVYEIGEYITANGKSPYAKWDGSLKDRVAIAKLASRIDRAAHGNFGDWKPVTGAKGVYEMRENYGPGYRIYYSIMVRRSFSCWPVRPRKIKTALLRGPRNTWPTTKGRRRNESQQTI